MRRCLASLKFSLEGKHNVILWKENFLTMRGTLDVIERGREPVKKEVIGLACDFNMKARIDTKHC